MRRGDILAFIQLRDPGVCTEHHALAVVLCTCGPCVTACTCGSSPSEPGQFKSLSVSIEALQVLSTCIQHGLYCDGV